MTGRNKWPPPMTDHAETVREGLRAWHEGGCFGEGSYSHDHGCAQVDTALNALERELIAERLANEGLRGAIERRDVDNARLREVIVGLGADPDTGKFVVIPDQETPKSG